MFICEHLFFPNFVFFESKFSFSSFWPIVIVVVFHGISNKNSLVNFHEKANDWKCLKTCSGIYAWNMSLWYTFTCTYWPFTCIFITELWNSIRKIANVKCIATKKKKKTGTMCEKKWLRADAEHHVKCVYIFQAELCEDIEFKNPHWTRRANSTKAVLTTFIHFHSNDI